MQYRELQNKDCPLQNNAFLTTITFLKPREQPQWVSASQSNSTVYVTHKYKISATNIVFYNAIWSSSMSITPTNVRRSEITKTSIPSPFVVLSIRLCEDLQNASRFRKDFNKFENKDDLHLRDTWKLAVEHLKFRDIARTNVKGTTLCYSKAFTCVKRNSHKKYLKNKYRTRMVDTDLQPGIRLIVSS